jgi:hypothetical protein
MDKIETEFDIKIKDNFLNQKDFNIIKSIAKNTVFGSDDIAYTKKSGHVFFTSDAPKEVVDILYKNVSNFFKIKILNINLCKYTMVAKSDVAQVHNDVSEQTNFQSIFYIEGNQDMHCGTGFYIKNKDKYDLNSHIGFRPNRIVTWDANVYHAPLSFVDSFTKRISLITQYKIEY